MNPSHCRCPTGLAAVGRAAGYTADKAPLDSAPRPRPHQQAGIRVAEIYQRPHRRGTHGSPARSHRGRATVFLTSKPIASAQTSLFAFQYPLADGAAALARAWQRPPPRGRRAKPPPPGNACQLRLMMRVSNLQPHRRPGHHATLRPSPTYASAPAHVNAAAELHACIAACTTACNDACMQQRVARGSCAGFTGENGNLQTREDMPDTRAYTPIHGPNGMYRRVSAMYRACHTCQRVIPFEHACVHALSCVDSGSVDFHVSPCQTRAFTRS